jgi:hypothetical protein
LDGEHRVVGRDDRHHQVAAHFLEAFAAIQARALEHQRQLRAAAVQQVERVRLGRGEHLDLQQRMLARQLGQRAAPGGGQQFGRNGDGEPVFQSLRERQRLHLELLELRSEQPGLRLQRARGGGGLGLAAAAVEQRQVELGLQVGDGHAHRRGHLAQRAGSGRERALVDHGQEDFDVVAGEGHGAPIYQ